MKKKEEIYQLVQQATNRLSSESLNSSSLQDSCVSAASIAKATGLLRNNISRELNTLFKEGRLLKIKGKPVFYLSVQTYQEKLSCYFDTHHLEFDTVMHLLLYTQQTRIKKDPFKDLIGYTQSLATPIQSAKAAVTYPPFGLHTLLLGESGVGKSLFAEKMFQYGKEQEIFSKNSAFISFNCADYAHNPQFLLSQLFGSAKGSYTGALTDKPGLIELANGGVLFLDEIHRLPPEGQEMLFQFIDKKTFMRLGETISTRKANVLIIGATTEFKNSTLLTTFTRRIPSTIWLPNLKEKNHEERVQLVLSYLSIESRKINLPIRLSKNALKNLLLYSPEGNLGQLKSDIQLAVSRVYLETRETKQADALSIHSRHLPPYILQTREGTPRESRGKLEYLLSTTTLTVTPDHPLVKRKLADDYEFITYYYDKLLNSTYEIDLQKTFEEYSTIVSKKLFMQQDYHVLFNENVQNIASALGELLANELGLVISKPIFVALALFVTTIDSKKQTTAKHRSLTVNPQNPVTSQLVTKIITLLERKYAIFCSENEFQTLSSIIEHLMNKNIGTKPYFIVVAHGNTIASSIADTVNELLDYQGIVGINMPLSISPNEVASILEEKIAQIEKVNQDIFIFVDMGSLAAIDTLISHSKSNLYVVQTVNTLIIMDCVQQALLATSTALDILTNIGHMNNELNNTLQEKIRSYFSEQHTKVIFTICETGDGTARFLKNILTELFTKKQIYDVEIIPVSGNAGQINSVINDCRKEKNVAAVVGSVTGLSCFPRVITLPDILLSNGFEKILRIVDPAYSAEQPQIDNLLNQATREIVINVCTDSLDKYLVYLSAPKIAPSLIRVIEQLERSFVTTFNNQTVTKLFIHIGCTIERISNEKKPLSLPFASNSDQILHYIEQIQKIRKELSALEQSFQISIPLEEVYYIHKIFLDEEIY